MSARGGRGRSWETPSSRQGQGWWCRGRLLVSARGGHGRPRHPRGTPRQTPSSLLVTAHSGRGSLLVSARGGPGRAARSVTVGHLIPGGTSRQTPSSLLVTARGGQGRLLVIAADPLEPARECPRWPRQATSPPGNTAADPLEPARDCPRWSAQHIPVAAAAHPPCTQIIFNKKKKAPLPATARGCGPTGGLVLVSVSSVSRVSKLVC